METASITFAQTLLRHPALHMHLKPNCGEMLPMKCQNTSTWCCNFFFHCIYTTDERLYISGRDVGRIHICTIAAYSNEKCHYRRLCKSNLINVDVPKIQRKAVQLLFIPLYFHVRSTNLHTAKVALHNYPTAPASFIKLRSLHSSLQRKHVCPYGPVGRELVWCVYKTNT